MTRPTIIHLTDTHIGEEGELTHGLVDTHGSLLRVLGQIQNSHSPVDALILSGDLTHSGTHGQYRRLREAVEPVARELGAQVIYAMGNHDDRGAFRSVLFGEDVEAGETVAPVDHVVEVGGLRVVVLDSTEPGLHDGHLDDAQLDWLSDALRDPPEHGVVLVLHHPPIPSPVAALQYLRLQQPERLVDVVRGSAVRMMLCGHNHVTSTAVLAGIPVWVGPALAYRLDPVAPAGRQRGFSGYGFSRVDLVESTAVVTAIESTPAPMVYDRSEQDVLDQLVALAEAGR